MTPRRPGAGPLVRPWSAAMLLLTGALVASAARADTPPNAWDAAKDPGARERWALHVRVERMLSPARADDDAVADPRLDAELRLEAARSMLEQADAAHSPDVRLRFDLGYVYYELGDRQGGRVDLFQKAIDVLAPAVDASPDDPATTGALSTLVYAYAKMNRPREELATWHRYIPRLVEEGTRVVAMMNMGEAEMRLGQVDDAVATFREVMRVCGTLPNTSGIGSTYVLALWDLAVAYDRSGDPGQALEAAARAARISVIGSRGTISGAELIEHDPAVFFVPEWERQWYLALLASAEAREAKDPREALAFWTRAEQAWNTYTERCAADGTQDTFLRIARVRQAQVHAKRLASAAAAAKLPPAARRVLPLGVEP
jgi:tetratricopeptide (TPR) repeat protein